MTARGGSADVLVIGGGAAGLAAAWQVNRAGRRVLVLEGRNRIGGRVLTRHDPEWPLAVELGAEFLHGRAEETRRIARLAGAAVIELPDEHLFREGGRWKKLGEEFWRRFDRLRSRIPDRGADVSFAAFLGRQRRLPATDRRLAELFVEGYHAADLDRISARSLAGGPEDPEELKQYRLAGGYDRILHWLRGALDPETSEVRLNTAVHEVQWSKGRVVARARTAGGRELPPFEAPHAIVALPLGVLKAPAGATAAVRFRPDLPPATRRALDHLEVSPVRKVVLRLREPVWDDPAVRKRLGQRDAVDFLHARGAAFPTWWTQAPAQEPVITAWAGGPLATALDGLSEAEVLDRALGTLAGLLGLTHARLEASLDSWAMHDWQADPFSRGAYTYIGVGGARAPAELARPISKMLFFAGEATDAEQMGTVAGAIASGKRAAREVLEAAR